jgi:hypothetical protein
MFVNVIFGKPQTSLHNLILLGNQKALSVAVKSPAEMTKNNNKPAVGRGAGGIFVLLTQ